MLRIRTVFFVFAAFALLCVAQCGLEASYTPWTAPIPVLPAPQPNTFVFKPASDNADIPNHTNPTELFLGYEVYYKIGDYQTLSNAGDLALTMPGDLAGHNFQRFHPSTDTWNPPSIAPFPLLTINDNTLEGNTSIQITIDFSQITQIQSGNLPNPSEATAYAPTGQQLINNINLRRSVQDTVSGPAPYYQHYKQFNTFWGGGGGDTDVFYITPMYQGPPLGTVTEGTQLNTYTNYFTSNLIIAVYVYAYGKSLGTSTFWQDITSPLCNLSYIYVNNFWCSQLQ